MNLRPYSQMKDSGVQWLGDVPVHWEARRLSNLVEMRASNVDKHVRDDEEPVRLCNYLDVYNHERIRSDMDFMAGTATAAEIGRFRLAKGDVLITKDSEDWTDIGVPAVVEEGGDDILCGYHLALLRPRVEIRGEFLLRALQGNASALQFQVRANGVTRYGLSHNAINSVWVPVPPLAEQSAIARFLDRVTGRLDRYIRAKGKLIALLEEYKQALVHQAVTGRIDVRTGRPYPAYRDAGAEWIGSIPGTWEVVALGRLASTRCDGPFGSGLKSSHYVAEGVRVVRLQNVGHGVFKDQDTAYIAPEHYATLGDHSVEPGDVLIAGLGDPRHPAGRACVAPLNIGVAMVKADCFRFRAKREVLHPDFAALYLTATAEAASAVFSAGATRLRVNLQNTSRRSVALPSMSEQMAIISYCKTRANRLDACGHAAQLEIALARKYRTRLIADVVTGKLDVQQAAADLDEQPLTSGIGLSKDGAVENPIGGPGDSATEPTS